MLERPQVLGSGDLYLWLLGICLLISEMGRDSDNFTECLWGPTGSRA